MSYDAVVIGGGIIGTCSAYYLAEAGVDVCLVERGGLASGASGGCQFGIGHVNEGIGRELTMASSDLYRSLAGTLPVDIEYEDVGNVYIADSVEQVEALEETEASLQGTGMPCQLLDRRDLLSLEPSLGDGVLRGLFFPNDATVHPMLATLAFAQAAEDSGANIRTFTEVTGITRSPDGSVAAAETTEGRISTGAVVIAAGAWSPFLGRMVDLELPVKPRRGHIVVTEPLPPCVNSYWLDASYFQAVEDVDQSEGALSVAMVIGQAASGNLLLGSSREFVGYDNSVNPSAISRMVERCLWFMPRLESVSAIRTYAGLRPYTPDLLPMIGPADGADGVFVATGHEGEGITMGPITGKLIAQLITGQEPEIPLESLSPSRFEA